MKFRKFGRTEWMISEVSFGSWAIGGSWGAVDDGESIKALHAALDAGTNLFDTADVYGDGRSERLLAQLRDERSEEFHIITKAGRRLDPHIAEGYNRKNLTSFIERSLKNLQVDALELVQLHCPPTEVYYMPEVFGIMDDLVEMGKIQHYGVSVEKVEEAIKAIEYPNVKSVQIIFNIFRQRPAGVFFHLAREKEIAILSRVPLSSGMLAGKMGAQSQFAADDHRLFNRHGESFDRGETFSGVDYQSGLDAVDQIRKILPESISMAQFALRWILMHEAVSCVIPGAKKADQVLENAAASDLEKISDSVMQQIRELYDGSIRDLVHHYW
jgi:aryl-alcohol dehydrogenase-like predicted oxidoreductase